MTEGFSDHPNAQLIARLYEARQANDWEGIASCFAENALWQYPGHNQLAGDYYGGEQIARFFKKVQELTDQSFGVNLQYILANDEVAVAYELPAGNRRGVTMHWDSLHLYHIEAGRIVHAKVFQRIQYSLDAYWWDSQPNGVQ